MRKNNTYHSICIIRLSALGDICHVLPSIRCIQKAYPRAQITWIIGKLEAQMLAGIEGIRFIEFDKKKGRRAFKELKSKLKKQRFDLLLHMQTSARANLIAWQIKAKIKVGFDWARSREGHYLVCNRHLPAITKPQHQLEDFLDFPRYLKLDTSELRWDIPIPDANKHYLEQFIPANKKIIVVNACSSPSKRVFRNWSPHAYADVINYLQQESQRVVVLCGGLSQFERNTSEKIMTSCNKMPINLVGKTSIKQLLALLQQAELLITSDSGPAHMANAVGTPVIALHGATNPAQIGPYLSQEWVVSVYAEGVKQEYQKSVEQMPWGTRVHLENVMEMISSKQVIDMLKRFYANTKQLIDN
ncbi:MAG: glycosyltransferase family 9 protein [Gammaproteobacteria bacterium]|nr:glycosyltransferase family 9 protein [Gammaproteobacteria bacterium]MDH5727961.1 glycosyltransferase family 9 protein [Gammaproteobacteria bacterium]